MRVEIKEKVFPKIKLSVQPCDWTDKKIEEREQRYLKASQEWELLKDKYNSEIKLISQFEYRIKYKVRIIEKLVKNCAYEKGKLIEVIPQKWEKKWRDLEVGSQVDAAFYLGEIESAETVRLELGYKRILPEWNLSEPPVKERSPNLHEAVRQCQQMILSVCPHARWDGFWNERPKVLGFLDSKKEETEQRYCGCTVYLETGTQYSVEVCEKTQSLVLSSQRIKRYFYYYEVTSVGEVGGSWSDKGYY